VETLTLDLRPSKRAEVQIGPPLLRGTRTVHIVLDRRRDRLYEMGAREGFVLSSLDGHRTLSEIGEQYAARFGRRLGAAEWARLLALLGGRNLLAGPALGGDERPPAAVARAGLRRGNRTLPGLSAFAKLIYSWPPPRVRGYLLAGTVIAALGMIAALAGRVPELASQAAGLLAAPWLLPPLLALLCLGAVCHEVAHALVALQLGVRDVRIGVRWNLPFVVPYCKAEEVLVLPRRRQRAGAALAGPVSHWVFLIPFFAIWLALPAGEIRDATGALLLVHAVLGLVNCVPWPGTDGYLVLSGALNMSHLCSESFRYLGLIGRGLIGRGWGASAGYPMRARCAYVGYAATLIVTSAALATGVGLLVLHAAGAR
jgi:putative peptide zinc metalloprotease protein